MMRETVVHDVEVFLRRLWRNQLGLGGRGEYTEVRPESDGGAEDSCGMIMIIIIIIVIVIVITIMNSEGKGIMVP